MLGSKFLLQIHSKKKSRDWNQFVNFLSLGIRDWNLILNTEIVISFQIAIKRWSPIF